MRCVWGTDENGQRLLVERPIVGGHPLIDERVREPDGVFQGSRVLQPGHGWLGAEIVTAVGQPPAGDADAAKPAGAGRAG